MTEQREMPGMSKAPATLTIGGATWTTRQETLRVYEEIYDREYKAALAAAPKDMTSEGRQRLARQRAADLSPNPNCHKKLSVCAGMTTLMVWAPGSPWSGRGWYMLGEEKYFAIRTCHKCGAWSEGWDCGLYDDQQKKAIELKMLDTAPLTEPEKKEARHTFDMGYSKGVQKRLESENEKGGKDRYRTRGEK